MALQMFLKLAGIAGESQDPQHKGEIDVFAWSWGLSTPEAASAAGAGAGAGRVKIDNISIQKLVDIASPLLISYETAGKHITDGTLSTRKAGTVGKAVSDFLLFKMTDVIVTSVNVAASASADLPTESITLNFAKFEFDYQPTKPDGSLGPVGSVRWDIATNKQF